MIKHIFNGLRGRMELTLYENSDKISIVWKSEDNQGMLMPNPNYSDIVKSLTSSHTFVNNDIKVTTIVEKYVICLCDYLTSSGFTVIFSRKQVDEIINILKGYNIKTEKETVFRDDTHLNRYLASIENMEYLPDIILYRVFHDLLTTFSYLNQEDIDRIMLEALDTAFCDCIEEYQENIVS